MQNSIQRKNKSSLIVAFLLCLLAVGGAAAELEDSAREPLAAARPVIKLQGAPARGPENAPVTIVEFADFQCIHCAQSAPAVEQILSRYPSQVRWVFKHFPLEGYHTALAHHAVLAAAAQGKFWDMYELLFTHRLLSNGDRPERADFLRYAETLELDTATFLRHFDARRRRGQIMRDIQQGRQLGVEATPTYFINGKKIVGGRDFRAFRQLIEHELADGAARIEAAAPSAE